MTNLSLATKRLSFSMRYTIYSFYLFDWHQLKKPGPASSVEERLLRKNFRPRGPRFESRRELHFRREKINSQFMFDRKSNYRTCYITHATSIGKKLLQPLHWAKENVAGINWLCDVTVSRGGQWRHNLHYTTNLESSNLRRYLCKLNLRRSH